MADANQGGLKDFKDLKLIGKGSFGRVFRAVRPSDNQEYAIKEVNIKAMSQREREDAVNEVIKIATHMVPSAHVSVGGISTRKASKRRCRAWRLQREMLGPIFI